MLEFEKTLRDALDKGVTLSSICRDIIADCKELERIEVDRAIAGANKVPNLKLSGGAEEVEEAPRFGTSA